jgi:hypothetical protein
MSFAASSARMAALRVVKAALPKATSPAAKSSVLSGALVPRQAYLSADNRAASFAARAADTGEQQSIGEGAYPQDEERRQQLHQVAQQMDAFFANKDEAAFDAVVSPNVTLRKDLLILDQDKSGADTVKETLKMYIDNYDYQHDTVAIGEDVEDGSAFHFWLHKELKPKSGEPVEANETKAAIWHYVVDDEGKVTDIHFLTQLTPEEKQMMLTDPKLGGESCAKFDVTQWEGPTYEAEDNRSANFLESAKQYSKIWETGDVSIADEILHRDFYEVNPIFGQEVKGRDNFKNMISGLYENYERLDGTRMTAVDYFSNKAFVYWESKGKWDGSGPQGQSLFGLNMLVFDEASQLIKTVVGFRQPLPNERVKYLKRVAEKAHA